MTQIFQVMEKFSNAESRSSFIKGFFGMKSQDTEECQAITKGLPNIFAQLPSLAKTNLSDPTSILPLMSVGLEVKNAFESMMKYDTTKCFTFDLSSIKLTLLKGLLYQDDFVAGLSTNFEIWAGVAGVALQLQGGDAEALGKAVSNVMKLASKIKVDASDESLKKVDVMNCITALIAIKGMDTPLTAESWKKAVASARGSCLSK